MEKKNKTIIDTIQNFISKNIYLIILLFSIPAVRYLFVYGYFGVSDDLHIGWLYEMDRVVKLLQFPPRYVPDLSYGFGYPLFNFVYPLPFYIAEVFHLLGFSLVNSVKIVFGLTIPVSMFFMYKLLKHYVSEELSLSGAILYVYAPYRALEIFVRGTIGEIVAFMLFPLIILSYIKITSEEKSIKWIGIAALSTSALILSHNIMAYMFMPFLLLFVVLRIFFIVKDKKYAVLSVAKSLFLGLLSSIYFWFPAIYESGLMKYDTVFNFYDHYPTLKQFITPYWGYGASVPGPYDTMSFYMGLTGIFVVVLGTIIFVWKYKKILLEEKVFIGWGIMVFLISVFMMNFRSAWFWRNLPLLPYFQFPWRFLAMTTLVGPVFLVGFSIFKNKKITTVVSFLVILFAVVLNFNYFKTSEYLGRSDDYYLNRYIPSLSASDEYRKTAEEYLRLPLGAETRPDNVYPRAYTDDKLVKLDVNEENALDAVIKTESNDGFVLNYNKYYYPGWKAKIDGKEANIKTGKPFGQVSLDVPSGKHEIVVEYRESQTRIIFDTVSLLGLGVTLFLIFRKK
jgi:hypothetical protein